MKKQIISAFVILLTFSAIAQKTTEKKESKFELIANSKLGFAKLNQSGLVSLNGNTNAGELLLSIKIGKKWYLAPGFSVMEFNANPTINGNTASIKNTYLQIPVKAIGEYTVFGKEQSDSKILLTIGIGLYANTLLKSEIQTVAGNSSITNLGWNFGLSTQIGAKFILSDDLNLGIGIENQGDLNDMNKNNVSQKMRQIDAFYFSVGFKL
ncbi:outer membrane beta-barrel protein [Flavobacterium sp.]|uniref:outer membrane beta-barrel protein n=1 Tax=Flavobacterium sp. TaxID=239 RepID=UPI0025DB6C1B|nr:outer membrane beta-barrel protein [Flavobacterium sp.]